MRTQLRRGALAVRSAWRAGDDRRAGRTRLHFLHVGKTGGTALKVAFGRGDVVTPSHRLLLHDHRTTIRDIPDDERLVVVVRDPVARFVSAFHSRRRCGRPHYDAPWSAGERVAFTRFPTADALARALDDPSMRETAVEAMGAIRHVREPLTHFLGDAASLDPGRIALAAHLEHLPALVDDLSGLIGVRRARLPDDPVAAHRAPSGEATAVLSEHGRAVVRRWYAADYAVIERLEETGVLRPAPG